jgi:UDP-N-acetylmuramyl tripeptide synthase
MVAEAVDPTLLRRLGSGLGAAVVVSGSNGKTTTARLLSQLLGAAGGSVVANASGANLRQGVLSALLRRATWHGQLGEVGLLGVFEVDEVALAGVAADLPAPLIVLTNLFRDQLDRFGETDVVVRAWEDGLRAAPRGTRLVYCADDPRLAALAQGAEADGVATLGFGLSGATRVTASGPTEVPTCPSCDGPLRMLATWMGHLGDFECPQCGFKRPSPALAVRVVASSGLDGQTVALRWFDDAQDRLVTLPLPGLVNAYNAAAAVAAAVAMGISRGAAVEALAEVVPAFGRFEHLEIDGRHVVLTLMKNPASLAELGRIGTEARVDSYLFAVNDSFADGRDTSWYWDAAPAEMLRGRSFALTGRRAEDLALRLRYAMMEDPGGVIPGFLGVLERPADALARAIGAAPTGGTVIVVATYTALMALRVALAAAGVAPEMPL